MNRYKACMIILTLCVAATSRTATGRVSRSALSSAHFATTTNTLALNNLLATQIALAHAAEETAQEETAKSDKDTPISEYKNLPKLAKREYLTEVIGRRLTFQSTFGYLKQLLKAVMYIDHRVRILENAAGISTPLLKEVTNVRNALKKITGTNKTTETTITTEANATPEVAESSTSQD